MDTKLLPLQFDDIPSDVFESIVYEAAKHGCFVECIARATNHPSEANSFLVVATICESKIQQNNYVFWRFNASCNKLHLKSEGLSFYEAIKTMSETMRDCFTARHVVNTESA